VPLAPLVRVALGGVGAAPLAGLRRRCAQRLHRREALGVVGDGLRVRRPEVDPDVIVAAHVQNNGLGHQIRAVVLHKPGLQLALLRADVRERCTRGV
jgi:hypothetical protein